MQKKILKRIVLAALLSSLSNTGMAAYDYTLPALHVYAVRLANTATVGSKIPMELAKSTTSISVINQDEIERLGGYRLTDALAYSAGITNAPRGYDALYDNALKIRGFEVWNTNMLVDGQKTFGTTDQVVSPEMYGIEQVEILRGPSSTLHGSGKVGGIINLSTKKPLDENSRDIRTQYGSNAKKMVAFDVNQVIDPNLTIRMVGMWNKKKLFYDETTQKRTYFAPAISTSWGENNRLTFLASYQDDDIRGYAYYPRVRLDGDPLFGILPNRYFVGVPGWDRYHLQQWRVGYEWQQQLTDNLKWVQQGDYRKSTVMSHQTSGIFMPANPSETGSVAKLNRFGAIFDSESKSYNLDQYFSYHKENTYGFNNTLIGFDWHYEKNYTTQAMRMLAAWNIENIPQYVAGKPKPIEGNVIIPMDPLRYWSREHGIYVHHHEEVDKLIVEAGIRKGWYEQYSERDESQYRQSALTGEAGLAYQVKKVWYPYIHWHNSFNPLVDQIDKDGHLLPPMKGREWEIGIRYAPTTNVYITAAVYDLRQQNVPKHVPNSGQPGYFESIGEIKSQGLELEWRAALTERLHLLGSYTYINNCVSKDINPRRVGKRFGGVAKHNINARVEYQLWKYSDGDITIGAGMRYLGERPNDEDTSLLGGVTIYDASLSYAKNNSSLSLHVRNLFDKVYYPNVESVWGVDTAFAGQERTWILSYIHKW